MPKTDTGNTQEFGIGELAREFGVTRRTLRFYESKGLLFPERNGNNRIYSRADRARLKLILLGKRVGLPLASIKTLLELYERGDNPNQLQAALEVGETQINLLRAEREKLDNSITELERLLVCLRAERHGSART
jgi:DNA-binding transcriptional MerR regulator